MTTDPRYAHCPACAGGRPDCPRCDGEGIVEESPAAEFLNAVVDDLRAALPHIPIYRDAGR